MVVSAWESWWSPPSRCQRRMQSGLICRMWSYSYWTKWRPVMPPIIFSIHWVTSPKEPRSGCTTSGWQVTLSSGQHRSIRTCSGASSITGHPSISIKSTSDTVSSSHLLILVKCIMLTVRVPVLWNKVKLVYLRGLESAWLIFQFDVKAEVFRELRSDQLPQVTNRTDNFSSGFAVSSTFSKPV